MPRQITRRELRNTSGDVMRALDQGHSFVVTRNGVPVGELTPLRARQFVSAEAALAAFAGAPAISARIPLRHGRCARPRPDPRA